MNQTSILVLLCLTALVFAQRGDENEALRRRRRLVYGVKPNEKNEADKAEFFSETFDELDENWHRVLQMSVSGKGKGGKGSKSSGKGKGGKGKGGKGEGGKGKGGKGSRL